MEGFLALNTPTTVIFPGKLGSTYLPTYYLAWIPSHLVILNSNTGVGFSIILLWGALNRSAWWSDQKLQMRASTRGSQRRSAKQEFHSANMLPREVAKGAEEPAFNVGRRVVLLCSSFTLNFPKNFRAMLVCNSFFVFFLEGAPRITSIRKFAGASNPLLWTVSFFFVFF